MKNTLSVFPPLGGGGGHLPNYNHPPKGKGREREGKGTRNLVQDSTPGFSAVPGRFPVLMCHSCSQRALRVRLRFSAR